MRTHNMISHSLIRMMQPVFAADGNEAPPVAATPWTEGLDAEVLGHIQNKGWDKLDAKTAIAASVKAYKEAERFVGIPADQLLRIPTDQKDEAGWKALRMRLGAPNEAKDYDFSSIKFADGTALDEGFASKLREAAYQRGLAKEDATFIADTFAKYQDGKKLADTADSQAKLQADKAGLREDWGKAFEANMFVAQQAAQKLGITPEAIAALEGQVGYRAVMKMFQAVGAKTGEDTFVNNPAPGQPGVMGPAQADARIADLKADKAWVDRYLNGDVNARREMDALTSIKTGQSWESQRAS